MKVFLVGGAVRDEIMGREVKDRDYVVVGSSHEEMISLGYVQVGADFPVYLHPVTKEEYALARTERKVGEGYHGFETRFTPDVTLEDDLARRDLTINSIAKDLETGEYIDPFGGIKDIENKVLRATTKAFRDDPLRILRLFRFRARLGESWTIDHITLAMVHRYAPLVSQLPKERKFKEMEKCFEDKSRPDLYLELLSYYTEEFPEVEKLYEVPQPPEHHPEGDAGTHTMLCVQQAAKLSPAQVFAVACHDLGKVIHFERGTLHGHEQFGVPIAAAVCDRMGVPKSWKRLALLVTEHHTRLHRIMEVKPKSVYNLIHALGGEKETDRTIKQFAECCEADAKGRGPTKVDEPYPQLHFLMLCSQDLLDNRKEISKLSAEIAEKWKGRPEMIASQVRALKISYVRRKMKEINTILNWEA